MRYWITAVVLIVVLTVGGCGKDKEQDRSGWAEDPIEAVPTDPNGWMMYEVPKGYHTEERRRPKLGELIIVPRFNGWGQWGTATEAIVASGKEYLILKKIKTEVDLLRDELIPMLRDMDSKIDMLSEGADPACP